ncbi:helix-turn-helix domain-containing protein [Pseudoalteromonas luteoviolacea]
MTKRQKQVLDLILQGYNNRQISNQLYISLSTVKFHCNNLYKLYGVNSRFQMFQKAINNDSRV